MRLIRRIRDVALVLVILAGLAAAAANNRTELTLVERLRVENNTLKKALVMAEERQLAADIEAAHPCCTWNTRTQTLEPKPEPPKGTP